MKKIAVVIPSYENSQILNRCLHSLSKCLGAIEYEVVVVDNASKKTEVVRLLAEIEANPKIAVIRNSANLGFASAVNRGVSTLEKASIDFDFFLILNQDSILMNDHITAVLDLMDRNPRIGLCGPRIYNGDGTVQNSFYAYPSPTKTIAHLMGMKKLGSFFRKVNLSPDLFILPSFAENYLRNYKKFGTPIEVPWLTGACLLIRKKTFDELSGFDEKIWMYAEDMDLCFRAKKTAWTSVFCPDWHVFHHGGLPAALLSEEISRAYHDSLSYFYTKHFRGVKKKCMLFLNRLEETRALRSGRKSNRKDI